MTHEYAIEMRHEQTRNRRAAIEMLFAAFGFATMNCIAHGFSGVVAWPIVAFSRIALTMVLVHLALWRYGAPWLLRGNRALWCRSLAGSMGLCCTFYAVTRLPVTDTVTIYATSPVWITLILVLVFRRKIHAHVWLHVGLALAGVYIMHRPAFDAESLPLLIALFGSMAAATAKVALSFLHNVHPLSVVAHYSAVATAVSLCLSLLVVDRIVAGGGVAPAVYLWLLPMGVAGTLAQLLVTMAYGRGSTTMVALVGISQIVFAGIYDVAVWGHGFDFWKVAGILMIACAIVLSVRASAANRRAAAAGNGEAAP